MSRTIPKGILKGLELEEITADSLKSLSREESTSVERVSFYQGFLEGATFRGLTFDRCVFAKSKFKKVQFRRCTFLRVDATRAEFEGCLFSGCKFVDSDLYNVSFGNSEITTSSFEKCYRELKDYNKPLKLFAILRTKYQSEGDAHAARRAEYHFRVWERKRLYTRWRNTDLAGPFPWLWSLFLGSLTGYGERPAYLVFWTAGVITSWGWLYARCFPFVLDSPQHRFFFYWYFSFRTFLGQGFSLNPTTPWATAVQIVEFGFGLVLASLLIGSFSRKLSS